MLELDNCVRVAKFGGSSLADAEHFKIIKSIFANETKRVIIIPSAPGKRFSGDTKVTDMLIRLYKKIRLCNAIRVSHQNRISDEISVAIKNANITELPQSFMESIRTLKSKIAGRYSCIARSLEVEFDASALLSEAIRMVCDKGCRRDYFVSRGEYFCARLLAAYMSYEFLDAKDAILFDSDGKLKMQDTVSELQLKLGKTRCFVIPGFYGSEHMDDSTLGKIITFSRGGSDVTGAIVARAVCAVTYENWTDVSGFFAADPRIVFDAVKVAELNFSELRELSCMGASVLHGSTVVPLMGTDIQIHVRNTNDVSATGTYIRQKSTTDAKDKIAGIAGKLGYTTVSVCKLELGDDRHFVRLLLHAFEACSVPVEHMPLSMDNVSFVTRTDEYEKHCELLNEELHTLFGEVTIECTEKLALIAVVSSTLSSSPEFAHVTFQALAEAGIELRMIDHGSGSNSIVIGVDEEDYEAAMRAIYYEFLEHKYI